MNTLLQPRSEGPTGFTVKRVSVNRPSVMLQLYGEFNNRMTRELLDAFHIVTVWNQCVRKALL